jgi:hypothetical protein
MRRWVVAVCLFGVIPVARAQSPVSVNIDLQKSQGAFDPVYAWVGYDESNYTTTENGRALLQELHDATPAPVYNPLPSRCASLSPQVSYNSSVHHAG